MHRWNIILIGLIGLIGLPKAGSCSEFGITVSAIAGGGGSSSGNEFSIDGTIGQPASGILLGETFELEVGFWNRGAAAPEASSEPTLRYAVAEGGITLFWAIEPTESILEFTESLNPPTVWSATTEVPVERDGFRIVSVPSGRATGFYRLRKL